MLVLVLPKVAAEYVWCLAIGQNYDIVFATFVCTDLENC